MINQVILNKKKVDNKPDIANGFNSYISGMGNVMEQKIQKPNFFMKSYN